MKDIRRDICKASKCVTVWISAIIFVFAEAYAHLPQIQELLQNNFGIQGDGKMMQIFAVLVIGARIIQEGLSGFKNRRSEKNNVS